jgi:hypothetical protein
LYLCKRNELKGERNTLRNIDIVSALINVLMDTITGSNPVLTSKDNQTRLLNIRIEGNTAIGFILSDDKILYHRLPKPPLIPMTYFWVLVVNTLAVLD